MSAIIHSRLLVLTLFLSHILYLSSNGFKISLSKKRLNNHQHGRTNQHHVATRSAFQDVDHLYQCSLDTITHVLPTFYRFFFVLLHRVLILYSLPLRDIANNPLTNWLMSMLPTTLIRFYSLLLSFCVLAHAQVTCTAPGTAVANQGCQYWPPSYEYYYCTSVSCTCYAGYVGQTCASRLCTAAADCSSRGTTSGVAPCTCACSAPYTGSSCLATYCDKNFHCNGRGTSITGSYPGCVCTCIAPYGGNACLTRICHVNFDCQGRGISITGAYPNCNCRCNKRFGGRRCRTLSMTLSLRISNTKSVRPTESATITKSLRATSTKSLNLTISTTLSISSSSSTTLFPTFSLTTVRTPSTSMTMSSTLSPCSPSDSLTLSRTQSLSPSLSGSYSQSSSATRSTSGTFSTSVSNTQSISGSASQTPTDPTEASTLTVSIPITESESVSATCRPYDDLDLFDTCGILRPLSEDWAPPQVNGTTSIISADWLLGKGGTSRNCTDIRITFDKWSGKQGFTHVIYVVGVESRIPLKPNLKEETEIIGSDDISVATAEVALLPLNFQFSNEEEIYNATKRGILRDPPSGQLNETFLVTNSYPTAVTRFTYIGKNTLNKVQYTVSARRWPRCPVTMSAEFQITLVASERLLPPIVAEIASAGGSLVSVGSAFSGSPTAVLQLSVVTSMKEMSRCMDTELDDASDDDSYDDYTSGVLNPLGLALGATGGGRRYIRGSLATSGVYLVLLTLLMILFTSVTRQLANKYPMIRSLFPSMAAQRSLLEGYPSALVAVMAFAMDGAVSTGTILVAFGDGPADRLCGIVAILLCVAYIAHMFYTTYSRFPTTLSYGVPKHGDLHSPLPELPGTLLKGKSMTTFEARIVKASEWLEAGQHEWQVEATDNAGKQWMRRYGGYAGDNQVAWYGAMEQCVALVVGILSALSIGLLPYCIARGVLCFIFMSAQLAVVIWYRPLVQPWRRRLLISALSLQVVTAVLSIANAPLQDQYTELALDITGIIILVILTAMSVIDIFVLIVSLRVAIRILCHWAWKAIREGLGRLFGNRKDSPELDDISSMWLEPDEQMAELPSPLCDVDEVANEHRLREEEYVKATILRDLEDYEMRMSLNLGSAEAFTTSNKKVKK